MKKLLAITLTVILALSLMTITASAEEKTYTGYLGTSIDWAFRAESTNTIKITGDGNYTLTAKFTEEAERTEGNNVLVIDIADMPADYGLEKDDPHQFTLSNAKVTLNGVAMSPTNRAGVFEEEGYFRLEFSNPWSDGGTNIGDLNLIEGENVLTISFTLSGFGYSAAASVPDTGVVLFIGIAGAALAVSGAGAVVVTRRLKKK